MKISTSSFCVMLIHALFLSATGQTYDQFKQQMAEEEENFNSSKPGRLMSLHVNGMKTL